MLALVSATALLGLLTSIALQQLHLHNMAWRYVISVAVAYAGFLGPVRLWILYQQRTWQRARATGDGPIIARPATQPKLGSPDGFSWLDLLDLLNVFDDLIIVALLIAGAVSIFFVAPTEEEKLRASEALNRALQRFADFAGKGTVPEQFRHRTEE